MAEMLIRTGLEEYALPAGDPGWFGPASIAWQVHADLGSMLIGGMSALLLQTLHPLVMQGVSDHSDYRHDPFGRLQRTAEFIAGTTYGGDALASSLVRHVRAIHGGVRGTGPGNRPYRAGDPELLRYVHVTETWSFLRAHQRYTGNPLLTAEKNQYLEEMAVVALRLGARDLPLTTEEVRQFLRSVRPELVGTELAKKTVAFLMSSPLRSSALQRSSYAAICGAAVDLVPSWARYKLGLYRPSALRLVVVRPSAVILTSALRFVAGSSPILEVSRQRAAG
ncbi:MAG: oxygenase MpaB family protein [Acidimicrobiales bacterium]